MEDTAHYDTQTVLRQYKVISVCHFQMVTAVTNIVTLIQRITYAWVRVKSKKSYNEE